MQPEYGTTPCSTGGTRGDALQHLRELQHPEGMLLRLSDAVKVLGQRLGAGELQADGGFHPEATERSAAGSTDPRIRTVESIVPPQPFQG